MAHVSRQVTRIQFIHKRDDCGGVHRHDSHHDGARNRLSARRGDFDPAGGRQRVAGSVYTVPAALKSIVVVRNQNLGVATIPSLGVAIAML